MYSTKYHRQTKTWHGPVATPLHKTINLGEALERSLYRGRDTVIQINHDTDNLMTCEQLRLRSIEIAAYLQRLGIQMGDHVAIILMNDQDELAAIYIGILLVGAVCCPLEVSSNVEEWSRCLRIILPRLVICEDKFVPIVTRYLTGIDQTFVYGLKQLTNQLQMTNFLSFVPTKATDITKSVALVAMSSSTIGDPKSVLISNANVFNGLYQWWPAEKNYILFASNRTSCLTNFVVIVHSILNHSARIISKEANSVKEMVEVLLKHEVSIFVTIPAIISEINKFLEGRSIDFKTIKRIIAVGTILSDKEQILMDSYLRIGKTYTLYSLTDVSSIISSSTENHRSKSVGRLAAGIVAKVIDENDKQTGPNGVGELYIKTNNRFLGYLNDDLATSEAYDAAGWMHTGDIVSFDEDGFLYLVGHKADILSYRLGKMYPNFLEKVLNYTKKVREACAVGIPDKLGDC